MVNSTEVLHIYRRILRAITYLPDSSARTYMHNEVVQRFRRHRPRTSPEHIISNRVKRATQTVRCLERAANGSSQDLQKVLMNTYGRSGARRRELVKDLLRPDEDILPKDDAALQNLIEKPEVEQPIDQKLNPKVAHFIGSQRANQPKQSDKPKIRQLQKPQKTIWDREPVAKLTRSRWQKWWAQVLDKLLPPVPQHEWDRLRDLALGRIPLEEFPKRRSRPVKAMEPEGDMAYRYLQLKLRSEVTKFDEAIVDPERGLEVRTKIQEEEILNEHHGALVPRTRRRLYSHVWSLTPAMSQDEATKRWTVVWGSGKTMIAAGILNRASARDMELFEGIENLPEPRQPFQPRRTDEERSARQVFRREQWLKAQTTQNA